MSPTRDTWMDWLIEPGTDPFLMDTEFKPKAEPMYDAVQDELLAGRDGP